MKKTTFLFLLVFVANLVFAQTTNYVPKYTGTSTFGNSVIYQNSNGNVGIGTTNPVAKFQVIGNSTFSESTNSITSSALIRGMNSYSTAITPDYTWYNNDQTGMFHPASSTIGFSTEGIERMRIKSNGRIGIGTTNPQAKFQIQVPGNALGHEWQEHPFAIWSGYSGTSDYALLMGTDKTNKCSYLQSINIDVSIAPLVLNPNGGNVGIGTINTQGYRFAVNGKMIATEYVCKLYANWPDYVFSVDYQLPTLFEVKQFINEHKHLPGVPSAAEVEETGIQLGEMNAILLQKIEEQMRYILEQQEAIEKISRELENVKNELKNK